VVLLVIVRVVDQDVVDHASKELAHLGFGNAVCCDAATPEQLSELGIS
jgi:hypothetical protein